MKEMSRLRAVVLNYGRPELTIQCVDSLRLQSFEGAIDIVVVDNGSPGDDESLLRKALPADVALVRNKRNVGYAAGNNVGIRWQGFPEADATLIINNDVVLLDVTTCRRLFAVLEGNQNLAAVSPLVDDSNQPLAPEKTTQVSRLADFPTVVALSSLILRAIPPFRSSLARFRGLDALPLPLDQVVQTETVNGACFMARNSFLRTIGGLDEGTFLFFEELILGAQIKERGLAAAVVTGTVVSHQQGATTGTGDSRFRAKMGIEMLRSLRHYSRSYLGVGECGLALLTMLWLVEIPTRVVVAHVRRVLSH